MSYSQDLETKLKWFNNDKKNIVLHVPLKMLNYMAKLDKTSSVLNAKHVIKLIFGKKKRINIIAKNIGLDYGWKKAIPFDNYVSIQGIANQKYIASKITGLILNLKKLSIYQDVSILSMMELISIKKDVLSV